MSRKGSTMKAMTHFWDNARQVLEISSLLQVFKLIKITIFGTD